MATTRYSYDSLNRLTEAAYGENDNLQSNTHRYTERVLTYSANGAIRRFQRHGLKDDGVYGKIDNLHISLDGNYIKSVTDDAAPVTRYAVSDFNESSLPGAHFEYSPTGALTRDLDRGIDRIEYDDAGYPLIKFLDGAQTRYVYTPDGVKVRTIHLTPASVAIPKVAGLIQMPMVADTTDYVGPVIYNRGGATTVRYEGGFATLDPSTAAPDFYHYVTDYQGNNRGVIHAASGQLVQETHYYPFGAVYADMGTGADLQPFKHGDKELDMMHGLCHYDYLARPYDPILCTFTRPDSRATSYPHISPRAFCTNNPVNYVDPDGNTTYRIKLDGQEYSEEDDGSENQTVIFYNENNTSSPIVFEPGTILSIQTYNSGESPGKYLVINIRGDENGKTLFEGASDFNDDNPKNKAEYSLWQTGPKGKNARNFIATSGIYDDERAGTFLYNKQLRFKYTIRNHFHNHVKPLPPSGFTPGEVGDKQFVEEIIKGQQRLNNHPRFYLYVKGHYLKYNPSSTYNSLYNKVQILK